MDDYPGDDTTFASYTVFSEPFEARHEMSGDVDWIRLRGLRKYFFHEVWLFRSTDEDYISFADLTILNSDSEVVFDPLGDERVPGPKDYHHFGDANEAFFVSVAARDIGGYRLYVRTSDYAEDTLEAATPFGLTGVNQFGSAMENNHDTDFLKYRLFEGIDYTFNLHGQASNDALGTTLGRMALRLFDAEGNSLTEDDQFGTLNNASIMFSPSETAEYIFEVDSDVATGSYVLESDQFDDFRGDAQTTGVLPTDGAPVFGQENWRFARNRFDPDQDWFRFEPMPGFLYEVESDFATLALLDPLGNPMVVDYIRESSFDNDRKKFRFTPESSGPYFVASERLNDDALEYSITANVIDDHIATLRDATVFSLVTSTGSIGGAIETEGDRDWIRFKLQNLASYRFTIDADPALRMAVSVRDDEGVVVATGVPFEPLNFSHTDPRAQDFYLDVRSNANETGTWTLTSAAPQGGNDDTTGWNVDLSSGRGRIRSLYRNTDTNPLWHRFQVTPNTWYEIESRQVDFDIRISNDNPAVASFNRGKRYYYSGSSTNPNRYIVVNQQTQSQSEAGFEIRIAKDARVRFPGTGQYSPDRDGFANNIFGFRNVEVYSTVPYSYESGEDLVSVPANSYATLDTQQWFSIEFDDSFTDVGELYFREVREQGNSQWSAMELYGHHLPAGVDRTPVIRVFGNLNFAFAEGRPIYLAEDDPIVGEMQPLTTDERFAVRRALSQWSQNISATNLKELNNPGPDNDAAPIMVYKAEIDSDILAFSLDGDPAGSGIAGDIILNTNSPLWDDFGIGSRGQFELLRAAGKALGAPELAIGRDQSVMGMELDGERANLPYPSTLLPVDIVGLRDGSTFPHPPSSQLVYYLDEDTPRYETITHGGFRDNSMISSGTTSLNATIDLRPGQPSFLTDGTSQPSTWLMSEYSNIDDARGGSGNDSIRGNHFDNDLFGMAGNDTLIGGVGNDFLSGGPGDDYYSYRLGHGNDSINEFGGDGFETLRIEGMKGFDGIEDLRFRRFGENLKITLELDGPDRNADSIVIQSMKFREFQVERLALISEGNFLHAISLPSLWAQTNQQLRRFELQSGSDEFGRLASPV